MPSDSEGSGSGSSSSGSDSESGPGSPAGSVQSASSRADTAITDADMKSVKSNSRSRSGSPASVVSQGKSTIVSVRSPSPAARSRSKSRSKSKSKSKSRSRSKSNSSRSSESSSSSGPVLGRKHQKVSFSSEDEDKKPADKPKAVKSSEVFGDLDEMSSGSDDEDKRSRSRSPSGDARDKSRDEDKDDEDKRKSDADDEDDDKEKPMEVDEEEQTPETRIDVEIPKITTDLGKSLHFIKLPNFLSVETRPFDPTTYEDEIDDEETLDEEGRARLKLKVENTIRWREKFNDKGVFIKESNARFVHWSDGSLSLHLGEEIFNVYKQPLQGDHNHLFIRQGTGLQGQAVFRTKLTFRPHSTESFTHRKMTMSLADRSTKTQGIKVLSIVGHDPEANRQEMIKKEEDKLRASVRRENKQRRVREKTTTRGLSSQYLDDDYSDDENAISISAIKNKYKKGVKTNIYSSDDDEGSDVEHGRKLERAKRLKDSEEEDEDEGDDEPKTAAAASEAPAAVASGDEKEAEEHHSD